MTDQIYYEKYMVFKMCKWVGKIGLIVVKPINFLVKAKSILNEVKLD